MVTRRGFSLTEVLVVIAVILILLSVLMVGVDETYTISISLKCRHRLEQLGYACRLFAENHDGRWPRSWNNAIELPGGGMARRRWYGAHEPYCQGNKTVFECPVVEIPSDEEAADVFEGTGRILYYNLGLGRDSGGWGAWSSYVSSRAWLTDPDRTPTNPDHVPYEADYAGGNNPADWLSAELLDSYDQVWILAAITYGAGLHDSELDALHAFQQAGGGIHLFAESHGSLPRPMWVECPNALAQTLGYGIQASLGNLGSQWMNFDPDVAHPVMAGVTRHETNPTPALLQLSPPAQAAGVDPVFGTLVAAWDGGQGRVIVHASFTTMGDSGEHWTHSGDDVKTYCNNAAQWLFGGSSTTGRCSYGYNDHLGADARTPGGSTICIMDYTHWRIRRGGTTDDPDHYIATRHGGRANALLGDGHVDSLRVEEITPGMWTPEHED